MLGSSPVVAVVAVSNLERGKEFYGTTLGLPQGDMEDPGGVMYACGNGTQLFVYESSFAGTNQATAATWEVSELETEVSALQSRGVSFEQYEMPGVEHVGVIHKIGDGLSAAWFKDPDGNILNLVSREA